MCIQSHMGLDDPAVNAAERKIAEAREEAKLEADINTELTREALEALDLDETCEEEAVREYAPPEDELDDEQPAPLPHGSVTVDAGAEGV